MASNDLEMNQLLISIALAGDGAFLGLGLAAMALRNWLKFNFNSKVLSQIQERPVSHIADLRYLLSSNGDAHGNRNPNHDIMAKSPGPLVIVRGMVQPTAFVDGKQRNRSEDVIIAPDSGNEAVIFQKTQTCLYNHSRILFGWSPLRVLLGGSMNEQVTNSVRKVPFVLIESDELKNLSHVHINLDNSRHPLPLTIAYQNLKPVLSTYTIFHAFFGQRYPVGLLDEEKILPPGQEITAIGRLHLTHNGHPVISSCKSLPCFLSELTKDQLVEEMAIARTVLFWSGMIFSTAAIGVLCFAAFRNWHKWKEWRRRRQRQASIPVDEPNTSNAADDESEDVPDGQLCVICLVRRRRSAFVPCGHHVCCSRCAHAVERDSYPKCPVCRQDVQNSVIIYDS